MQAVERPNGFVRYVAILVLVTIFPVLLALTEHLNSARIELLLVQVVAFTAGMTALQPWLRRLDKRGQMLAAGGAGLLFYVIGKIVLHLFDRLS